MSRFGSYSSNLWRQKQILMEQDTLFRPRQERIRQLLTQLAAGIYERDYVLAMAFLSAIAGESIFLLGLPGVGKSLIARRLKLAFRNAQSFEYLMSRFSTPDEIFGPVSISKLKNEDTYERLVEGYLPTADVVFLDEIWKAGPSIQNALLTVLNEKLFRNGDHELRLPLKGIISASNELPAQDEGLEALWDRYLIRIVVPPLISEKAFYKMILGIGDTEIDLSESLQITAEEYAEWQIQIDRIAVPSCILGLISKIRGCLKQPIGNENDGASKPIFVSDRRWKKIIRLLRTAAFLNGRNQVERIDCLLMTTTLWDDSDQLDTIIPKIELIIIDSIVSDFEEEYQLILSKREEIRLIVMKKPGAIRRLVPNYRVVNGKYYNLVGYSNGETLIDISEYESISLHQTRQAVLMEHAENVQVLSAQRGPVHPREMYVNLTKEMNGIKINDVFYPLEISAENPLKKFYPEAFEWLRELDKRLDTLVARIEAYSDNLSGRTRSPFISDSQFQYLKSELARLILRIRKLKPQLYYLSQDE